jgi:hypothetical protein
LQERILDKLVSKVFARVIKNYPDWGLARKIVYLCKLLSPIGSTYSLQGENFDGGNKH